MTFKFEKAKKKPLVDVAYELIKRAIVAGDLLPGVYLREVDIARQMGTSRGPIREALTRLDQEGLTFSHPFRGTVVLETSNEEMEEVFVPARRTIELFAAMNAHKQFKEAQYLVLEKYIEDMSEASLRDSVDEITEMDIAFHSFIVENATSPSVRALWNNIVSKIHARMIYQGMHHEYLSTVVAEHTAYLELIKEGDSERIVQHLQSHVY